jgi:hypothetical protein
VPVIPHRFTHVVIERSPFAETVELRHVPEKVPRSTASAEGTDLPSGGGVFQPADARIVAAVGGSLFGRERGAPHPSPIGRS